MTGETILLAGLAYVGIGLLFAFAIGMSRRPFGGVLR